MHSSYPTNLSLAARLAARPAGRPAAFSGAPAVQTSRDKGIRRGRCLLGCALILAACGAEQLLAASQDTPSPLAVPARTWAVDCSNNEILVIQHPDSYLRYRLHVVDEKGDQLRDQIETPEGSVARLIQRDGRPITPEQDAAERGRLTDLLASPSSFLRHIRHEEENKRTGVSLLRLMPDAMLWTYTPGQPQLPAQQSSQPGSDSPLIVLDFKPNPQWSPPTMEAEPLTGLQGRIWIDPRTRRMVRLEGDIFHAVNIGWGMVAHIYPGGKVTLHQVGVQSSAPGQRFIVDHVDEQLTLRALMIKTVRQRLIFDTADFQPVPSMPYQQAIKLLLDTPLPTR
jgi:hypothetical protein